MKVTIVPVREQREVNERLIDSTGLSTGPYGPRSVVLERTVVKWFSRKAVMIGREFVPPDRVEQAVRDARVCRCGNCVCCSIAKAVRNN